MSEMPNAVERLMWEYLDEKLHFELHFTEAGP